MSDAAALEDDRDQDLRDGIVATAGLTSFVFDEDDEALGHVLLCDLDDADLIQAIAAAEQVDGISALFESSGGSYHVWGLSVGSLESQTLRSLSLRAGDDKHVGSSWRRGYSVLRLTAKVRADDTVYKDAPELIDVFVSDSDRPQSRAHFALLETIAREQGDEVADVTRLSKSSLSDDRDQFAWVGDESNLRIDRYQTIDDATKEALR